MLFVRAYPRETQEMVFDAHAGPQHGIDLGCRTGLSVFDRHQQ